MQSPDNLVNAIETANPDALLNGFAALMGQPAAVLLLAVLLELIPPLPDSWRLYRCQPIFSMMAGRVNRRENTDAQRYFAGILLPVLIILVLISLLLLFQTIAGFDRLLDLVFLVFLLESRVPMVRAVAIFKALSEGDKERAREILKPLTARDVDRLSPMGLAKAATEEVIMRTFSSWFAVMAWYSLAGLTGALIMQLCMAMSRAFDVNLTRYQSFGRPLHRMTVCLLLIPALLFSFCMLFSLHPLKNLSKARADGHAYPTFVTGFVLGLTGSALNLSLGGPVSYEGQIQRPARVGGDGEPGARSALQAYYRVRLAGVVFLCLQVLLTALLCL